MAQRSKAYKAAKAAIGEDLYSPVEAIRLAKETNPSKTDATVEVALRLSVDPRKADQMVRGSVSLPHGTGKTARVVVFATGDRAEAARAAGADVVGDDDLIARISEGWVDFDAAVASPELMGKVGRLGKVLGPRNLMPNPKTGTVTPDVAKAVADIKGGKIDFRVDKHSNLHFIIGKTSFEAKALVENYAAALEEVLRLKPSSSKGRYISKATVATPGGRGGPWAPTGPGVDPGARCAPRPGGRGPPPPAGRPRSGDDRPASSRVDFAGPPRTCTLVPTEDRRSWCPASGQSPPKDLPDGDGPRR